MCPPSNWILFAGPTLAGIEQLHSLLPEGATLLPPVRRGDLPPVDCPPRGTPAGVIAIVDGLFHQHLAVGHREIRDALEAGWQVWGLSSMGAIRAYEMRRLGMRGFGRVYERFLREEDFQDDEVALLHEPDPPYRAQSEPLVHLREALERWAAAGWLRAADAGAIAADLKRRWYGERTLPLFRSLVMERVPPALLARLTAELAGFDRYRVKSLDLADFLRSRPWAIPSRSSIAPSAGGGGSGGT